MSIQYNYDHNSGKSTLSEAIKELAKAYAEEWLAENIDEVNTMAKYANINPQAMANLILIEASNQVKDNLMEKKV